MFWYRLAVHALKKFQALSAFFQGRDYSTVDGRSTRKCYWSRESCDCGWLQIDDETREVKFLSNDYTNPNTSPKTLTTLALTLTDHHDAFESFFAPVFCDFVRNYSSTVDGAVVTLFFQFYESVCPSLTFISTSIGPSIDPSVCPSIHPLLLIN